MRVRPFLCSTLLALLGMALLRDAAAAPKAVTVPLPGKTLGVTTSLTTSGYQFRVGPILPQKARRGTAAPDFIGFGPTSFLAAYCLTNHSSSSIPLQIPQPKVGPGVMAIMLPRVIFSVYDDTGALIWASSTNPPDLVYRDGELGAGSSLRQETHVPLLINGAPLNGDYTLVAAINGSPEFNATASFKVTSQTVTDANDVQGTVLAGPISPVTVDGQPNERPVAGAIVRYRNAAIEGGPGPGVFQQAVADANGHFSFNVPTGTYIVTASIPGDQGILAFGTSTQTINVTQGQVTQVTFHLDTGIR